MERPYKIKRPAGLETYITKVVADKTYLIFDRKRDVCRCSRCGTVKKISEMNDGGYLVHNGNHYCYKCGHPAICKEARYGRKNITEFGRILWFRKVGRVTFAELDEYQIDYTGFIPKVTFWPSAQYRFSKESQVYYKHVPAGWRTEESWEQRKEVKLPSPYAGMWNSYKVPRYEKTVTHTSWASEHGTDLKYASFDMLRLGFRDPDNPYALIGYIYNFLKYPSIEILEKSGFEKIVGERANGYKCSAINWRSKDLRKILKMNMAEIRQFRGNATLNDLSFYWKLKKMGIRIAISQLEHLNVYSGEQKIERVRKYAKIEKVARYLEDQNRDIGIYADYLEECEKLGYSMKDKRILFPADLMKAHKETSIAIEVVRNKAKEESFRAGMKKIYAKPPFTSGDLVIRAAESIEELIRESKVLCHCVRTYIDRVAEARCAILFIRKKEDPETPYYTLEINAKGDIVQCRGDHNCSMTEDVKEFVQLWHRTVVKKKKGAAAA